MNKTLIGILRDSIGLLRGPHGPYVFLRNGVSTDEIFGQAIVAMFSFVGGICIQHHEGTGRNWDHKES